MNEKNKKRTEKDQDVDEKPEVTQEGQILATTLGDLARAVKDPVFRQQLLDEAAADQSENPQKETPAD